MFYEQLMILGHMINPCFGWQTVNQIAALQGESYQEDPMQRFLFATHGHIKWIPHFKQIHLHFLSG